MHTTGGEESDKRFRMDEVGNREAEIRRNSQFKAKPRKFMTRSQLCWWFARRKVEQAMEGVEDTMGEKRAEKSRESACGVGGVVCCVMVGTPVRWCGHMGREREWSQGRE